MSVLAAYRVLDCYILRLFAVKPNKSEGVLGFLHRLEIEIGNPETRNRNCSGGLTAVLIAAFGQLF